MDHQITEWVYTYGYWLISLGAFIEGDTFLVAGGLAAQKNLLNVFYLVFLSIVFSMLHDLILFYIGRIGGRKMLKKMPKIEQRIHTLLEKINQYGVWIILVLRFAYGFRTLIPIALGMSEISQKKFWFYDFIGGVIWSFAFIVGGFVFGKALDHFLAKLAVFGELEKWTIAVVVIAVIIAGVWGALKWLKGHALRSSAKSEEGRSR